MVRDLERLGLLELGAKESRSHTVGRDRFQVNGTEYFEKDSSTVLESCQLIISRGE